MGLKVESASTDVSEKDIDEAIEQLSNARYNEIEAAAEVDDFVRCSYGFDWGASCFRDFN